jgi:hypothetical protein
MGPIQTSIGLTICVLLLAAAIILDRRPYRPGKLNYVPMMIVALAGALVLGRHLLGLLL